MTLWTAADAARATGGEAFGDWRATGVSIDTRTIAPGDLFVALTAARDGHDFVVQALEKGAAAAMVSRRPEGVPTNAPLLVVEDVQCALEDLGRAGRARSAARVVAVTGSVGKTSTKEMLRAVLSAQGATHAAEASYNNHWGVPLTLARLPRAAEFAVIEIGMNAPGEIAPLSRMARPHVAMITAIAPAHLDAFDDISGIAEEKASIFAGLEPGGKAVINADTDHAGILFEAARAAGAEIVDFGETAAHFRLTRVRPGTDTTVAEARSGGGDRTDMVFKVMSPGRHFAVNGLGVIAAVAALGADTGMAAPDLARWQPPSGRGTREVLELDDGDESWTLELIDDAFNANPASVEAALDVLAASRPRDGVGRVEKGRRIAVLGDMLELGAGEMAMHAALAELPQIAKVHTVHCAGPRMQALWAALPEERRGVWVQSAEELAAGARRMVDAGDVVLVKGSKGSRISLFVDALRRASRRLAAQERDS